MKFSVGDKVRRRAFSKTVDGEIVHCVPPNMNPRRIFQKFYAVGGSIWRGNNAGSVVRDDWSFIVRTGRSYYWPRTSMLEKIEVEESR